MTSQSSFEREVDSLKQRVKWSSFRFSDPLIGFRTIARKGFGDHKGAFGVYIIREARSGRVLYIGKGGTIRQDGTFKKQDILGRLLAPRGEHQSGEPFFNELFNRVGCLEFAFFVLGRSPSPGLVEAQLLQSYLDANNELPEMKSTL